MGERDEMMRNERWERETTWMDERDPDQQTIVC